MPDLRTVVDQEMDRAGVPSFSFTDLARRRRRRQLAGRAGTAVLALVLAGAAIGGAIVAFDRSTGPVPVGPHPTSPGGVAPMPIPPLMHNGPFTLFAYGGVRELDLNGHISAPIVNCGARCSAIPAAAWTADGSRLAYLVSCGGGCGTAGDPYHGIRVLDLRTAKNSLLAPGDAYTALAWSPDGTRIAFAVQPSDGAEDVYFHPNVPAGGIFVMNVAGTVPAPLRGVSGQVNSLSWSPDGTSILYGEPTGRMYLERLGGAGPVALGPGVGPAWSPDGTRIAYSDGFCGVWTMAWPPDGSVRTRIAHISAPQRDCHDAAGPVWSPDGTGLAIHIGSHIWLMRADGSHLHVLARTGARPWSSDPFVWRPVP